MEAASSGAGHTNHGFSRMAFRNAGRTVRIMGCSGRSIPFARSPTHCREQAFPRRAGEGLIDVELEFSRNETPGRVGSMRAAGLAFSSPDGLITSKESAEESVDGEAEDVGHEPQGTQSDCCQG